MSNPSKLLIAVGSRAMSESLKHALSTDSRTFNYKVDILSDPAKSFSGNGNGHAVVVTDYTSLLRLPKDLFSSGRVLVLDSGLEKETIATLFLTQNISGFFDAKSNVSMLKKAIRVVHKGEIWIDNPTIKLLLNKRTLGQAKDMAKFTERENAVIKLVGEGYRNKEIAEFLSISEQTIKSHLNRVFKKMNVSTRTEMLARLKSHE